MKTIISLLIAIGFGGILGAYFQSRFQRQKEIEEDIHNLKRKRYGSILIQMLTVLKPDNLAKAQEFRPELKTVEDFFEEIKTEALNGILFASDEVIESMIEFIRNPNKNSYLKTVVAMRKDLWGKDTSINEETLDIIVAAPEKNKGNP